MKLALLFIVLSLLVTFPNFIEAALAGARHERRCETLAWGAATLHEGDDGGDGGGDDDDLPVDKRRRDVFVKSLSIISASSLMPCVVTAENEDGTSQLLGPLSPLIGTWTGSDGLNIVAMPSRRSQPSDKGRFELIIRPYRETLTFAPIEGAVRNRGGNMDQYVGAITYQQEVISTDDIEEVIHVENGMLFHLNNVVDYETRELSTKPPFAVARTASIPHGNSAMLLGNVEQFYGAPVIPDIRVMPLDVGPKAPKEYLNPYYKPINVVNPHKSLRQLAEKQTILKTTHLSLDSNNRGSVTSVPFLVERANTTRFRSDFWLETLTDGTQQLQYSQTMNLEFHKQIGGDKLVTWPHVTVNTLTKRGSGS